jgi:hypothetical protein
MILEFLVDSVDSRNDEFVVTGLVNCGDIRLGSVFTLAFKWPSGSGSEGTRIEEPRNVHLAVVKIMAYRRELDGLPFGMTGELFLEGNGKEEIVAGIMMRTAT